MWSLLYTSYTREHRTDVAMKYRFRLFHSKISGIKLRIDHKSFALNTTPTSHADTNAAAENN